MAALAVAFALAAWYGATLIPAGLLEPVYDDVWFTSDPDRVYANMTYRGSDNTRAVVHPLFLLMAYPAVFVVKQATGLAAPEAVVAVMAAVAGLWGALLFAIVRCLGCRRLDATVLCLLGVTSAASLFWFTVPETFGFGSAAILGAVLVVVLAGRNAVPLAGYVVVNVLTLGMTSSNWMVGALATVVGNRIGTAIRIVVIAFAVAGALWGVQKVVSPSTGFFLDVTEIGGESTFVTHPHAGGPLHVSRSFFFHTMVMPEIRAVQGLQGKDWPIMVTQRSLPGSASAWGLVAVVLWGVLLAMGVWALLFLEGHRPIRAVLGLALVGQLGLHMVYGLETFLYSLHFLALLMPLVALAFLTRARLVALPIAWLLLVCALVNNVGQLHQAVDLFDVTGKDHRRVQAYQATD
jgi:hypothetical protein